MLRLSRVWTLPVFLCVFSFSLLLNEVRAQNSQSFTVPATAVNADTLKTPEGEVHLWGVEALEISGTSVAVLARTLMDDLIGGNPVRCRVRQRKGDRIFAQCLNAEESDLALLMLQNGYAVVDRSAVRDTVQESVYRPAENRARQMRKGAWAFASPASQNLKDVMGQYMQLMIYGMGGLGAVLLLMLLIIAWVLNAGVRGISRQQEELRRDMARRQEAATRRERSLVASAIESELKTNRDRIEAFILIYGDMLKTLKDRNRRPKYMDSGEVIHRYPALSRAAFDANRDRMDALDENLMQKIAAHYAHVRAETDYFTLEPHTPREQAIHVTENAIKEAENLLSDINILLKDLNIVLRGRTAKTK